MTKHVHAELMLEYAKDAMETDRPWERWEFFSKSRNEWRSLECSPTWWGDSQFRRKPKPYEPTLLDEALELEIEALFKRVKYYISCMNSGFVDIYFNEAMVKAGHRSPEMVEHLKAQGKL